VSDTSIKDWYWRHDGDRPERGMPGVDNKSLARPRTTRFPSICAVSGQPDQNNKYRDGRTGLAITD
jgi:hypothetical protein